ncbi:hypothetical protein HYC85_007370 [Camellia sinensis]|uniref:Uncharacterized protein n=1 Tax=Camellia sinensis TaxID=4442 RepID=A0A7J7HR72_CAMSI|nr:hypothetical protein HYC85_007370 [Camellia sinensis]
MQATGEDSSVEPVERRRAFRALLDVGLIQTTGNRVFGALKVSWTPSCKVRCKLFRKFRKISAL